MIEPQADSIRAALDEVEQALATDDPGQISDTTDRLTRALARADVDRATLAAREALGQFRRRRRFKEMALVAEAATRAGSRDPQTLRQYCQGLIELGLLTPALATLSDMRDRPDLGSEDDEVDGLIGRVNKQRFVDSPDSAAAPTFLTDALDAYYRCYVRSGRPWHAINVVALLRRAEKDKISVAKGLPVWRDLASNVLAAVTDPARPHDDWNPFVAAEAHVALEDFEAAGRALEPVMPSEEESVVDAFPFASALRQLREVWRVDESVQEQRGLVTLLEAGKLRAGDGSVELPTSAIAYSDQLERDDRYLEKTFGSDSYRTIRWYKAGLKASRSVVRITERLGNTVGTGFLVEGQDLHPSWRGELVVLTNFHVVNRGGARVGYSFERVGVVVGDGDDEVAVAEVLAESPVGRVGSNPPASLDFAVLRLEERPKGKPSYRPSKTGVKVDDRVFVIGYPLGRELAFSLDDNRVVGSGEGVVHYRSPTKEGSSGSPLFDSTWGLVGIHHGGKEEMPRLDDPTSYYRANEGFLLETLRAALAASPPA